MCECVWFHWKLFYDDHCSEHFNIFVVHSYIAYNYIQFILSIIHWLKDLWSNLSLQRQSVFWDNCLTDGTISWQWSIPLTGCVAYIVYFDIVTFFVASALVLIKPQDCGRKLCTRWTLPIWLFVSSEMELSLQMWTFYWAT